MADKSTVLAKLESIQNCVRRLEEKKPAGPDKLRQDYDLQDILSVNIERVVHLMVDIGLHILSHDFKERPADMASVFDRLCDEKIVGTGLTDRLKKSVCFRNIAVHEYEKIDWDIVYSIADKNIDDFTNFTGAVLEYLEAAKR